MTSKDEDLEKNNTGCDNTTLPLYRSLPNELNTSINLDSEKWQIKETHYQCAMKTCKILSPLSTTSRKLNMRQKLRSAIDPSLFKDPLFYTFIGSHVFGSAGIMLFHSFFPPIAKEHGLSDVQTALLVSLHAALDLVCRILIGFVADMGWFQRYRMQATAYIILGTVYQCVRYFTSFPLMVFYVVMFGMFSAFFYSLHPSIAVDFFGKEKFPTVYGYVQFTHGVVRIAGYPLIGALRDWTGDYAASCHCLGAGMYAAVIFLLVKPFVVNLTV